MPSEEGSELNGQSMSATQPRLPNHADAALLIATAETATQAGAFEAAREAYVGALRVMPAAEAATLRVRALGGLGWTVRKLGDTIAALGWYEQAFATQLRGGDGDRKAMATLRGVIAEALMALGRFGEALAEYEAVLALNPAADLFRAGALSLAGEAAARAGRYGDAKGHQQEAVELLRGLLPAGDPHLADALSKLGYSLLQLEQWPAAETALREALASVPGPNLVATNLVHVLVKQGRTDEARALARDAYRRQSFTPQPPPANSVGTLLLLTALEGNIPIQHLVPRLPLTLVDWHIDFSDVAHEARLPRYDVALNLVGDADVGGDALRYADGFKRRSLAPLLNDPAQVQRTKRQMIPDLLAGIPGLVAPRAVQMSGAELQGGATLDASELRLPVLLRVAGRHGGESVRRIERMDAFDAAVAELPADASVYITQYHEYASPDGLYRKYRAIFVDRVPLPYHLAISPNWLVHYFSAEMEHDDRLAEERAFLADMPACLGPVATAALAAIARRLDLDYCGADFSLLPDGRLLLFESNATMLVHPEAPGSRLGAKNPFIDRILLAFEAMVMRRAGLSPRPS